MNLSQKIVLVGWAVVVLFFGIFFVPFHATLIVIDPTQIQHQYFNAPIWTTEIFYESKWHTGASKSVTINTQRWLIELCVPTVIAGALFFFFGGYLKTRKEGKDDS